MFRQKPNAEQSIKRESTTAEITIGAGALGMLCMAATDEPSSAADGIASCGCCEKCAYAAGGAYNKPQQV